jgi:hypothetical protein
VTDAEIDALMGLVKIAADQGDTVDAGSPWPSARS